MTGAIFARGSCRALKWMTLFGVVFALVAGQAAAQVKISDPSKNKKLSVAEGGRLTVTVSADIRVAANQAAAHTWTVAAPTANTTNLFDTTDTLVADQAKGLTDAELVAPADITLPTAAMEVRVPGNPSTVNPLDTTVSATFTIQAQSDGDAEDEVFNLLFADTIATGLAGLNNVTQKGSSTAIATPNEAARTRRVTISDTDEQEFIWEVKTAKPKEGSAIMVELMAKPTPNQLQYVTALRADTTGYSVSPSSWTFDDAAPAGDGDGTGPMASISISTPNPDKNRDMDTIMVEATVAGTASSRVPALKIEVADIHALPMADKISAMAYMDDGEGKKDKDAEAKSVMEGGDPVHVTVTVDRGTSGYPMDEALEVSVMGAGSQASDYRIDPAMVTVAKGTGEKSATFKLWALADDDVGEEELMLTLTAMGADDDNGPGEVMQMFSIMIEDATTPKVWVKDGAMDAIYGAKNDAAGDDEMVNPGENFEIMTDDIFGHLPTVTVAYAASSDNSAVGVSASGDKIMVMPQDMAGTAKITITATATDKPSSFKTSQDRSDVAQVMFEVAVALPDLMITLSSEDENIVEGGMGATVTAMANRAVAEDTMVMLMRDRSESTAGDDDYTAEPITIKAGEKMGSTMVMAVEDDMMENMNNMPEELVLYGMAGDMQVEGDVHLHIWDAAVPALPIIAQLLLAALLGLGGYRRYLRR